MNRSRRAPSRKTPTRRAPKKQQAQKPKQAAPPRPEPLPPLRLGFVRGIAPSKWAERWARAVPEQPLELVPLGVSEVDQARTEVDVLLERVAPSVPPIGTSQHERTRHALRLYEETVALVVDSEHELADRAEIGLDELSLITLIDHPDHWNDWPAAGAWQDPAWMPKDAEATLELVASGLGGALMSLPLARHLAGKRTHAVIPVTVQGEPLLPGTEIWASWAVERDGNDVQRLIGTLRGRTSRSSR